jgi:phosphoribosylformimino-5-aminoimidazole carboxamide ribotide isomerase
MPSRKDTPFLVIPAVDLLGNEAVRLEQGDFARISLHAGDPGEVVERFAALQPAWIHVVDLDGARSGRIRPALVARLVAAACGAAVQASGGVRTLEDAEALLEAGAARVIVGTAAFQEPRALDRFAAALGERLVVAVDARRGRLALAGWERDGGMTVEDAASLCAEAGVARLHCTAVDRDGTMAGPDLGLLARVRDRSGLPVLAAGGIRSEEDLRRLAELGLEGAVVGRALLEGAIPLSAVTTRRDGRRPARLAD